MAEQVGEMYVTIDGRDLISKKLEEVQKVVNNTAKVFEKIDGKQIGKMENFDYAKKALADLSQYYVKLQHDMSKRVELGINTRDLQRELDSVMVAIKKIYNELGSDKASIKKFLTTSFESKKGTVDKSTGELQGEVKGMKEIIDEYSKSVLDSARSTHALEQSKQSVAKVLQKEASNYESATESIKRYISTLESLQRRLSKLYSEGNLSVSTKNDILSAMIGNTRAVNDWQTQLSDKSMTLDRGIKTSNLTTHVEAKLRSREILSAAGQEDNRNRSESRRIENEATASVIAQYKEKDASSKAHSEQIKREALAYESLRKAARESVARTAQAYRVGGTPITASEKNFSNSIRAQMMSRENAEKEYERTKNIKSKAVSESIRLDEEAKKATLKRFEEEDAARRARAEKIKREALEYENLRIAAQKRVAGTAQNAFAGGTPITASEKAFSESLKARMQNTDAIAKANAEQYKFLAGLNETGTRTSWLGEQFQMLKGYIISAFAVDQLRTFLTNIVQIGGQLENQRMAIGAILGNRSQANDLFDRIKSMAVKSPFGVLQLDQYTKSLSAYGFQYNELYDTLKRLADISAGAGVDVNRLTLAIGHVKAETALTGITLRQFTMANIPLLEMLSDKYSELEGHMVSVADVRKRISEKRVSYDDVMGVIKTMTDEGGRFYDMQNVLSDSLKTKWKNLGDQMDIVYGEMAEGAPGEALKSLANILMVVAKNWKSVGEAALTAVAAFGAMKVGAFFRGTFGLGANRSLDGGFMARAKNQDMLYRSNLNLARTYRQLTAEELSAVTAGNKVSMVTFKQMVASEKLTKEHALRLVATRKLSVGQLKFIQREFQLTEAEMRAAYGAKSQNVAMQMLSNGVSKVGAALGGLLASFGPMIAMFAAFEVGFNLWEKHNARVERGKELIDEARESYDRLDEKVKSFSGDNTPTNADEYKEAVDDMLTIIKDYGVNTENIIKSVFETTVENGLATYTKDAKEQFEELLEILQNLEEFKKWESEKGNMFSNADNDKFTLFGAVDTMGENMRDASDEWKEFVKKLNMTNLKPFEENIEAAKKSSALFRLELNRLQKENDNKPLGIDKIMQVLFANPKFKIAQNAFINKNDNFFTAGLSNMRSYYNVQLNRMLNDADSFSEKIKEQMGKIFTGIDFTKPLSEKEQQYLDQAYYNWVKKFGDISDSVQKVLLGKLSELQIHISLIGDKPAANVAWKNEQYKYAQGRNLKYGIAGNSTVNGIIQQANEYASIPPAAQSKYKELEAKMKDLNRKLERSEKDRSLANENIKDAAKKQLAGQLNRVLEDMEALEYLAEMDHFDIRGKIKDKKGAKGRDTTLEYYQNLLKVLKMLDSEYQKYVGLRTKAGAIEQLKKNKEFDVLKKILGDDFDYSDYAGNSKKFYEAVLKGLAPTTKQRKDFRVESSKHADEMEFRRDTITAEDALAREMLDIEAMKRRFASYNSMRGLGTSFASRTALLDSDKSLMMRFMRGEAGELTVSDMDSIKELETQKTNLLNQIAEETKLLEGLSGREKTVKEEFINDIRKMLASTEQQLLDLKSGKAGTLDNVEAIGNAGKWVETGLTSDAFARLIRQLATSKGYNHTEEQFYAGINPTEDSKKKLLTNQQITELYGDSKTSKIWALIEAYKQAMEQEDNERKEVIKSIRERSADYKSTVEKINADADKQIRALGGDADKQGSNGVTPREAINAERNRKILEASAMYANFFNKEFAKTERWMNLVGKLIKKNLEDRLKAGLITAKQYAEEMRKIENAISDNNYNKNGLFGGNSNFSLFMKGGVEGMLANAKATTDAIRTRLTEEGANPEDAYEYQRAKQREDSLQRFVNNLNTATDALAIATGVFDGLQRAATSLSNMFYALGNKSAGNTWSDISDTIGAVGSILAPVNNIVGSALRGDVSGVVSNAISAPVEMIAAPITGFAKLHDKKIQREIEELERQNTILVNGFNNLKRSLEDAMGGMYNSEHGGDYGALKSNLNAQLSNTRKRLAAERDKKDSDESAIIDYEQKIKDLEYSIQHFAQTAAQELYGVDFHAYASDLANALIGAWESGASAAKNYRDAVSSIMKNLAVTTFQKKYLETKLEPIMDSFMSQFERDGGKITDSSMNIISRIYEMTNDSGNAFYEFMDAWERLANRNGSTLKANSTGMSPSIAGVTEDTADLLASYINNIRIDVSLNRENLTRLVEAQMPLVTNNLASMLGELTTITYNTGRSADASEEVLSILNSLTNGTGIKKMSIQMT